ncbi:lysozyme, partial [Xanthobacter autotrophicus]|uniref:lysozyme n=1 Tax=Xanthobacter autotrophicus TaxID=280 RepID=UPI003727C091
MRGTPMAHRDTNAAGLALIKSFESFVGYVYDDLVVGKGGKYPEWTGWKPKGTLTIGYGHTNDAQHPLKIEQGLRISEPEAVDILNEDLDECEDRVSRAVKVPLNDNQFGALVSFDFNTGAIFSASFVKRLNAGDYGAVPNGLMQYVKAKGQTLRGLVRRRQAEVDLWNKPAPVPARTPKPAPKGNVVPQPPVEDEPLTSSGVMQGAGTAAAGGGAMAAKNGTEVVDALTSAEPHVSAGTWIGLAIGVVILAGAAYALWSRAKAAGRVPAWLGG